MTTLHAALDAFRRPEALAPMSADAPASGHATARVDSALAQAILAAPTLAALEALGRALWARWASGDLADDDAQSLASLASARRAALKGQGGGAQAPRPPLPRARFPARRPAPRVDRAASRARRRLLAASGVMPPALAQRFTTGELAALKIVADEIAARGDCRLPVGAIAARAGVSETTARNALRAARRDGLLTIEARPRRGLPSLTNIVRMVCRDWRLWIARRAAGGGCKTPQGTDKESGLRARRTPDPTSRMTEPRQGDPRHAMPEARSSTHDRRFNDAKGAPHHVSIPH